MKDLCTCYPCIEGQGTPFIYFAPSARPNELRRKRLRRAVYPGCQPLKRSVSCPDVGSSSEKSEILGIDSRTWSCRSIGLHFLGLMKSQNVLSQRIIQVRGNQCWETRGKAMGPMKKWWTHLGHVTLTWSWHACTNKKKRLLCSLSFVCPATPLHSLMCFPTSLWPRLH